MNEHFWDLKRDLRRVAHMYGVRGELYGVLENCESTCFCSDYDSPMPSSIECEHFVGICRSIPKNWIISAEVPQGTICPHHQDLYGGEDSTQPVNIGDNPQYIRKV